MQRLQYTPEQKAEALRLLAEVGLREAARLTGISPGTVGSWGSRAGVKAPPPDTVALVAAAATLQQRKADLADELLTRARTMIAQLDATMVEKKSHVVSHGRELGSSIKIATIKYSKPPTGAQKQIVETIAILIAQVQLLTGDATARIESNVHTQADVAKVRGKALEVLDELGQRRVA